MRTTVAHFRILEKIGEGGMGEVWRAEDTRLDRLVALKFLPPDRMADPERRLRFVQEAKAASALNHLNIVTIYEIGSDQGLDYIAMEYVSGKTLEQLIGRKGVAIPQAIKWAIQIASALASAHSKGIVHRDVKPGNVMVSDQGVVKVLDFGLSKLMDPIAGGEQGATATIVTGHRTEEGKLVGTVAYMSPEQAEGRPIDARSDIFSFGALLYEMTTGHRPFAGDSKLSILAGILREEPAAVSSISPDAPHDLERIIARCLRKDPARRYQVIDEARIALEDLTEDSESAAQIRGSFKAPRRSVWPWIAAAALVAIAAAIWRLPRPAEITSNQPLLTRLTYDSGLTTDAALSPDGRLIAYASDRAGEGGLDIWVRQLAGGDPTRITNRPEDEYEPQFAPDGTRIVYRSDGESGGIYTVSALGGQPRLVAPEGRGPRYSPDGKQIAFWRGNPKGGTPFAAGAATIWVVSAEGGQSRRIASDCGVAARPEWTEDGKHLLFTGQQDPNVGNTRDIWLAPVDGGPCLKTGLRQLAAQQNLIMRSPFTSYTLLVRGAGNRYYVSLQAKGLTNLWSVKLSPPNWKAEELRRVTNGTQSEVQPSIAGDRIAFTAETDSAQVFSVRFDANRALVQGPPEQVTHGDDSGMPDFSADGKKLLYTNNRPSEQRAILRDLASGADTLIVGAPLVHHPKLSPDGERVAYRTGTPAHLDLMVASASGGVAEKLCADCGTTLGWTNDSREVLFKKGRGIGMLTVPGGEQSMLLDHPKNELWQPQLSADSRWIVFLEVPGEGHSIVHIAPYRPGVKPEDWISITSASVENDKPRWSPSGDLIYYTSTRDGYRCIWAQRLNPATKRPLAEPFPVLHFHSAARSLSNVSLSTLETAITPGLLAFVLGERRGNIWLTPAR